MPGAEAGGQPAVRNAVGLSAKPSVRVSVGSRGTTPSQPSRAERLSLRPCPQGHEAKEPDPPTTPRVFAAAASAALRACALRYIFRTEPNMPPTMHPMPPMIKKMSGPYLRCEARDVSDTTLPEDPTPRPHGRACAI